MLLAALRHKRSKIRFEQCINCAVFLGKYTAKHLETPLFAPLSIDSKYDYDAILAL